MGLSAGERLNRDTFNGPWTEHLQSSDAVLAACTHFPPSLSSTLIASANPSSSSSSSSNNNSHLHLEVLARLPLGPRRARPPALLLVLLLPPPQVPSARPQPPRSLALLDYPLPPKDRGQPRQGGVCLVGLGEEEALQGEGVPLESQVVVLLGLVWVWVGVMWG